MSNLSNQINAVVSTGPDLGVCTGMVMVTTGLYWEESHPRYIRQVQYPDGRIELQGGYVFGSTTEQGIKWKALPLVQVSEQGEVL